MNDRSDLRLSPRIRYRSVGDEGVVVHMDRAEVSVLNTTGLRVLELLKELGSVDAVTEALSREYGVDPNEAAEHVEAFLAEIQGLGLIEE
jgi:PqqD family protein of HPr-rel-A system